MIELFSVTRHNIFFLVPVKRYTSLSSIVILNVMWYHPDECTSEIGENRILLTIWANVNSKKSYSYKLLFSQRTGKQSNETRVPNQQDVRCKAYVQRCRGVATESVEFGRLRCHYYGTGKRMDFCYG